MIPELIEAYVRVLNTERYQRFGKWAVRLGFLTFLGGLLAMMVVGPSGPYREIGLTVSPVSFVVMGVGFLVNPYVFSSIYADLDDESSLRLVGGFITGVLFLGAGMYILVRL